MAFAQLLHAAGESSDGKLSPGTYAVALAAESQLELERIARTLNAHGVMAHRVVESHGPYAGQLMALGVAPGLKSICGRYLSNLKLLRMGSFLEFKQRQEKTRKDHLHAMEEAQRASKKELEHKMAEERREQQQKVKHYIKLDDSLWRSLLTTVKSWWRYVHKNGAAK